MKTTTTKIHFLIHDPSVQKRKVNASKPFTASVSKKNGLLRITGRTCISLGMVDKFITIIYEPAKKMVGWKIVTGSDSLESLKRHKLVKLSKNGVYQVSVKPILDQMIGLKSEHYNGLEIQKYVDYTLLGNEHETYYYVKLREPSDLPDEDEVEGKIL